MGVYCLTELNLFFDGHFVVFFVRRISRRPMVLILLIEFRKFSFLTCQMATGAISTAFNAKKHVILKAEIKMEIIGYEGKHHN